MIIDLPDLNFNSLFTRQYVQQTTVITKETYVHKTKRLIYEKFGKHADDAYDLCFRESGCRYNAINSTSGACGLAQAWPCEKLPCGLTAKDIECQINWYYAYISKRYATALI